MAEYIDRDKLIEGRVENDPIRIAASCEPAVNVAPVKHGKWEVRPCIKSIKYTNIPVVRCTVCGIDFCDIINNHNFLYRYCPNCGAKMDLEG